MRKIKFFRKNGRVCEKNLTKNQLIDMRDKFLQGYNDVSEDDSEVEVVSQSLSAKQQAEMEKLLAQRLKAMVPDVHWSRPKCRFFGFLNFLVFGMKGIIGLCKESWSLELEELREVVHQACYNSQKSASNSKLYFRNLKHLNTPS